MSSRAGMLGAAEGAVVSYVCDRERSVVWGPRRRSSVLSSRPLASSRGRRPGRVPGGQGVQYRNRPGRRVQSTLRGRRWASAIPSSGTRRWCARTWRTATSRSSAPGRTTASSFGSWMRTSPSTRWTRRRQQSSESASGPDGTSGCGEDPESVAARYRAGELDIFDLVRQYGVIVDWGTGELFAETTKAYRDMMKRRSTAHWSQRPSARGSEIEAAE